MLESALGEPRRPLCGFGERNEVVETLGNWIDAVRWNSDGLVPAIAQDHVTGQVLMLAWMNSDALTQTVATGQAVYFSRSRQKLWKKGESSGHTQFVKSIRLDCDEDVVLLGVEQAGGIACHTGRQHCFYRELRSGEWHTVDPVLKNPDEIYAAGQQTAPGLDGDE